MIPESVTWRSYLDGVIRRLNAESKRQLLEAIGITRTSILRWRSGETMPKAEHLERLLAALPGEQSEQLRQLLTNDPRTAALLPSDTSTQVCIPADFYVQMFRLQRDAPDRFWLLCHAVLTRALTQLETHPCRVGMELAVARCMPPREDGKVRSLRMHVGIGTPPWRGDLHTKDYFLGAESLAGCAIARRHGEMVPDIREKSQNPVHAMEHECSTAAYPIMRENGIAGVFIVSCCRPHYFSPERLTLIEHYADLLSLAFYDHEFYPATIIDLGLMPHWTRQLSSFETFRQRVESEYRRAIRQGESLRDITQAEQRVRSLLEEELLQVGDPQEELLPSGSEVGK